MDALVGSMLRHVSGNFKAKSGSQNQINKWWLSSRHWKQTPKADNRRQWVASKTISRTPFGLSSHFPCWSLLYFSSSSFFLSYPPKLSTTAPIDTAQHRILLTSGMKEIRNGREKTAGQGKWVQTYTEFHREGKENSPWTPETGS